MLHGRAPELAEIDTLLTEARKGRSAALVVRGEAGIGKTALLEHVAADADGLRVLRGTGIESEAELPFAGLHLLLGAETARIAALPDTQARALRAAFGLADGPGGDRFLVGLAVLSLLAELAEDGPLLCLVDDAHWLDHGSAEALLFAARRLHAEGVVLLFAARDEPAFLAHGLPELRLGGLDDAAAELVLAQRADLPGHVLADVRAQAAGNPLALLELPGAARAGGPPPGRVQQAFAERVAELPERTRTVLLVAAADDSGEPGVVLAAAAMLGCAVRDLQHAEQHRLLATGDRLEFRHPLIRTAVYGAAPLADRLVVHRALAEVFAERNNVCGQAWHLAAAATGPDEHAAATMEQAAELDRGLGGYAAVAAAYERAAGLSPDRAERGRRLIAAAQAAADAGQAERASALAAQAAACRADPAAVSAIAMLRARLADEHGRPLEAHQILVEAATTIDTAPDSQDATVMFFWAVESAWAAGDFAAIGKAVERAGALGLDRLLDVRALGRAAAGLNADDPAAVADGVRALRGLLATTEPRTDLEARPDSTLWTLRKSLMVAWWHLLLGDHGAAHELAVRVEREARANGAVGILPPALSVLARTHLHFGHRPDALACGIEGLRIADEIGQEQTAGYLAGVLAHAAAVEGDRRRCTELAARAPAAGHAAVRAQAALVLLDLGLGRHEAVLDRLDGILAGPNRMDFRSALPDVIEAGARLGRTDRMAELLARYTAWAEATGQPWAAAVAVRCRALLGEDPERSFAEAGELHRQGTGRPFEQARTELLHGEWLRRERRPSEARPLLRSAVDRFDRMGARPWAERARTELRAAGERSGERHGADVLGALTPQELQVVRLAANGLSNRDIGTQLFLSPRTVGYHLYKAYPKLGVTSRTELVGVLAS